MMKIALLCLFAGCAMASYLPYRAYRPAEVKVVKVVEKETPPEPYEFQYETVDEDGNKQSRQESGDAQGNKKGSYSIQGADGINRWVEYVADDNGVRMVIRTNEPGTDNQNPADVEITAEPSPVIKQIVKKVIAKEEQRKYKLVKVPIYGEHHGY